MYGPLMARTDKTMLAALLQNEDRLSEEERAAFADMQTRVQAGWSSPLSSRQKEWVERVYFRLELDAEEPSENLYSRTRSSLPPPPPTYPWETAPKPLKPPGRK